MANATEDELRRVLDQVAGAAKLLLAALNSVVGHGPKLPKELLEEIAAAKKAANDAGIRLQSK